MNCKKVLFLVTFLILSLIVIFPPNSFSFEKYNRKDYPHWVDSDRDGQNTREEVLEEESLIAVTKDERGKIIEGLWVCPYTGRIFHVPFDLDVDHVVPLGETHKSGGYKWTRAKKRAYANYLGFPDHLIAVDKKANRSKGKKDPSEWMPPNRAFWIQYLNDWKAIKAHWGLEIDEREDRAIRKYYTEALKEYNY
jgi:hypothetical protein